MCLSGNIDACIEIGNMFWARSLYVTIFDLNSINIFGPRDKIVSYQHNSLMVQDIWFQYIYFGIPMNLLISTAASALDFR